jgi:hypothetical protein
VRYQQVPDLCRTVLSENFEGAVEVGLPIGTDRKWKSEHVWADTRIWSVRHLESQKTHTSDICIGRVVSPQTAAKRIATM